MIFLFQPVNNLVHGSKWLNEMRQRTSFSPLCSLSMHISLISSLLPSHSLPVTFPTSVSNLLLHAWRSHAKWPCVLGPPPCFLLMGRGCNHSNVSMGEELTRISGAHRETRRHAPAPSSQCPAPAPSPGRKVRKSTQLRS